MWLQGDERDALLPMHKYRLVCGSSDRDNFSRYLNFEDDGMWFESGKSSGGSALDGCIKWSYLDGCLGSGAEIRIRNLEIQLDDDCEVEIRYGRGLRKVDYVNLYFENCFFVKDHIWPTGMKFIPEFEFESRNFEENSVDWPSYLKGPPNRDPDMERYSFYFSENIASEGCCSFSFPRGSEVNFRQNDFIDIFVRSYDDGEQSGIDVISLGEIDEKSLSGIDGMSLNFRGNRFGQLELDFSFPFRYPVKCNFFDNEIDVLNWIGLTPGSFVSKVF